MDLIIDSIGCSLNLSICHDLCKRLFFLSCAFISDKGGVEIWWAWNSKDGGDRKAFLSFAGITGLVRKGIFLLAQDNVCLLHAASIYLEKLSSGDLKLSKPVECFRRKAENLYQIFKPDPSPINPSFSPVSCVSDSTRRSELRLLATCGCWEKLWLRLSGL